MSEKATKVDDVLTPATENEAEQKDNIKATEKKTVDKKAADKKPAAEKSAAKTADAKKSASEKDKKEKEKEEKEGATGGDKESQPLTPDNNSEAEKANQEANEDESAQGAEGAEEASPEAEPEQPEADINDSIPEEEIKEAKKEDKENTEDNKSTKQNPENDESYPRRIKIAVPTTVYRGPHINLGGKPVGGLVTVTGPDVNGFTPVEYVRSGFGKCKGYIRLPKEARRKCQ